ncbi:RAQPRD family integrative conjugative element protein [Pseudorhodoferax soli]|uniref:RAQPRD family integrative conjugative element protein n=1 Tax=Pseudorhodoferax soli TaxID=545864 RepID=A0A368XE17_9BURK|nr:RAQPRD family integrative conjugative element protein [Pseudorhodoferax soli]RCW66202.1 RAQPRD family integrative conjugative element protein [Pseudorhodoferax soli]
MRDCSQPTAQSSAQSFHISALRNLTDASLGFAILAAAAAFVPTGAHAADEELEREQLARIAHEIAQLEVMVAAAAQTKPTGQRVRFRYEWLQRDLLLVREGITQHTDAPRQPRPVPPLRGDYRQ